MALASPVIIGCAAALLWACGSKADATTASTTPPISPEPSRPLATSPAVSAVVSSAPAASPPPSIAKTPTPTAADWKGAKPLEVTGARELECVAEGVREWVRVSCRDRSFAAGGRPLNLRVLSGKAPDVLTYAHDFVVSVELRFVPGTHLKALFGFDSGAIFPLEITWPETSATPPTTIGAFAGVPNVKSSDLDGCEHIDQVRHDYSPFRTECLRTFEREKSCSRFFECSWHEPSGSGTCGPGEALYGVTAFCGHICKSELDCPEGFECISAFEAVDPTNIGSPRRD